TPCVDGYVIISAARLPACSAALARRSSRSTSPFSRHATTTTRIPASAAEAALVPCALDGIRQTSRCGSPPPAWGGGGGRRPGGCPFRAGGGGGGDAAS